jgi:tetrahydrodipicolinate N-succinyltransferase
MRARHWSDALFLLATVNVLSPNRGAAQLVQVGSEFLINTITVDVQTSPDVGIAADGTFVVTWQTYEWGYEVRAQRFARDGRRLGPEVAIDPTAGDEFIPSVGVEADGDFQVVWLNHTGDGSSRLFERSGAPKGDSFQVAGFASKLEAGVVVGKRSRIGDQVIVRRNAVIGSDVTIEDLVLIGAGARIGAEATLGMGARIGRGAVVAQGAVVPPGTSVPPGPTPP